MRHWTILYIAILLVCSYAGAQTKPIEAEVQQEPADTKTHPPGGGDAPTPPPPTPPVPPPTQPSDATWYCTTSIHDPITLAKFGVVETGFIIEWTGVVDVASVPVRGSSPWVPFMADYSPRGGGPQPVIAPSMFEVKAGDPRLTTTSGLWDDQTNPKITYMSGSVVFGADVSLYGGVKVWSSAVVNVNDYHLLPCITDSICSPGSLWGGQVDVYLIQPGKVCARRGVRVN